MKSTIVAGLAAAILSVSSPALAVPVQLTFSGTVTGSDLPGANNGDTIIFTVYADNGGASHNGQVWIGTDVTSATISAGSYSGVTSGPIIEGIGGFSTDALGNLTTLDLNVRQDGVDSDGNTLFRFFMNGGNPIWFASAGFGTRLFGAVAPPDLTNTSISLAPTTTPLPPALSLFATGLGALGLFAYRRKRKHAN